MVSGVPYLKVEWEDKYNYFRCITSRTTQTWTTIEKYEDIQKAYPELVRDFEENIPREKCKHLVLKYETFLYDNNV